MHIVCLINNSRVYCDNHCQSYFEYACCIFPDIDGYVARKLDQTSEFGAWVRDDIRTVKYRCERYIIHVYYLDVVWIAFIDKNNIALFLTCLKMFSHISFCFSSMS